MTKSTTQSSFQKTNEHATLMAQRGKEKESFVNDCVLPPTTTTTSATATEATGMVKGCAANYQSWCRRSLGVAAHCQGCVKEYRWAAVYQWIEGWKNAAARHW